MKAIISKNGKFIQLSEKPKEYIRGGLKVYFYLLFDKPKYELPIMTTNILVGKIRYYLPPDIKVGRIEIKNRTRWNVAYAS